MQPDKKSTRQLLFINTHFDHRGRQARLNAAGIIREFIESQPTNVPVIITGDFNCGEQSAPYKRLMNGSLLTDTYRQTNPDQDSKEGTFNGFRGTNNGERIDWILTSSDWITSNAAINRHSKDGRFPSDHYPVTAELKWRPDKR